jgi:hypothetical protein
MLAMTISKIIDCINDEEKKTIFHKLQKLLILNFEITLTC